MGIGGAAPGAVAAGAGPSAAAPGADLPWLLLLALAGAEADFVATAAGDGYRTVGAMEPSPPFEPSRRDRLRAGASGFAAGFLSIDLPRDTGAGGIRLVETTADGTSGAAAAAADPAIGAGVGVGSMTGIGTAGVTLGLRLPLCGAGIAGGSRPEEFHGALPRSLGSFRTGPKAPALGPSGAPLSMRTAPNPKVGGGGGGGGCTDAGMVGTGVGSGIKTGTAMAPAPGGGGGGGPRPHTTLKT